MESIYEYGSRAGFWRLWRLFTGRAVPVTVYGVATAMMRGREQVAAMREAGWEIASHGLKWIEYKDFSLEAERAHMQDAIRIHTEVAGSGRSAGTPAAARCAPATGDGGGRVPLLVGQLRRRPALLGRGAEGAAPVVPYTLDANDMRFASAQGFNSGDQFFAYLKDSFDVLYAEGESAPKMMSVGLHCRLAGRPGRAAALARFLDYAGRHAGVWFCRRVDIARHWMAEHPCNRE